MERNEFTESEFEEQERLEQQLSKKHAFAKQSDHDPKRDRMQRRSVTSGYDLDRLRNRAKQRIGKSKDGPPTPTWRENDEEDS